MYTVVMTLLAGDPRHGTNNGYSNHNCRCDACRAAATERMRGYRLRYPEQRKDRCPSCGWMKIKASKICLTCHRGDPPKHGEQGMYRRGCRCPECRSAEAARKREYRHRTGQSIRYAFEISRTT